MGQQLKDKNIATGTEEYWLFLMMLESQKMIEKLVKRFEKQVIEQQT